MSIFTHDGPRQWSEVRYPLRPSAAERILAAIAHFMTIFSLPGMLLATIIWLTQRRRSRYVAVQARQAVLWQTLGHIIVFLAVALLLVTAVLAVGGSDARGIAGQVAGSSMVGSVIGLFLIPIGATAFFFASSLVGAIASLLGKKYTYPFIGRLAHRSVQPAADLKRLPPAAKPPQAISASEPTKGHKLPKPAKPTRAK
ncbi:MAG: DUF4870 domain-containing protein [Nitrososphaerota archaeon]